MKKYIYFFHKNLNNCSRHLDSKIIDHDSHFLCAFYVSFSHFWTIFNILFQVHSKKILGLIFLGFD